VSDWTGSGVRIVQPGVTVLETFREEVARTFDLLESTTTATGLTTSAVDTTLGRFADDYHVGANFFVKKTVLGGAPEGDQSWVTDFVAATGTLTLSPALSVALEAAATYQLYPIMGAGVSEINHALGQTCIGAEIVTSLVPADDTLDYIVTGALGLYRRQQMIGVWRRDMADVKGLPVQINGWQFEDAGGSLTIRLPYTLSTNDQLWIHYYAGENSIAQCASINLSGRLIRARTVKYLIENLMSRQGAQGLERWGGLLRYWTEEWQRAEAAHQRVGTKIQKHPWFADFATGSSSANKALGLTANFGGNFANYP